MQERSGEVYFVRHAPCPSCGSRDNLGIWSDSHTFCFGCGYRTRATDSSSLNDIKYKLTTESRKDEQQSSSVRLPSDASSDLPLRALAWLKSYGLTNKEIHDNKFMWSDRYERLLFPIHSDGDLLMFQGRYFGKEKGKPKYFTVGNVQDTFHLLGNNPDCNIVILTEDLISAIKISRQYYAMPVFGSHVPLKTLTRLSKMFSHIRVWLDGDKATESLKFSSRGKAYFDSSRSIITELDPKELDDTRIKDLVEGSY